MTNEQRVPVSTLYRAVRSTAIFFAVLFVMLFAPAGDIRWAKGWLFLLIFMAMMLSAMAYLWRANPYIFAARSKIHAGTKGWDKVLVYVLVTTHMLEYPVASFDDGRFHWSSVPAWVLMLGYALLFLGFGFIIWVEKVNRYAEPGVRVHGGQKVIDTGPYAIVRHPMYLGSIPYFIGTALALGSYWALVPGIVTVPILLLRTVLEDRTLQNELPGYKEYAGRIRYRLFPGLW